MKIFIVALALVGSTYCSRPAVDLTNMTLDQRIDAIKDLKDKERSDAIMSLPQAQAIQLIQENDARMQKRLREYEALTKKSTDVSRDMVDTTKSSDERKAAIDQYKKIRDQIRDQYPDITKKGFFEVKKQLDQDANLLLTASKLGANPVSFATQPKSATELVAKNNYEILSADYGSNKKHVDVTDMVKGQGQGKPFQFKGGNGSYNKLFGDPDVGASKTLSIVYKTTDGTIKTKDFAEDKPFSLP